MHHCHWSEVFRHIIGWVSYQFCMMYLIPNAECTALSMAIADDRQARLSDVNLAETTKAPCV